MVIPLLANQDLTPMPLMVSLSAYLASYCSVKYALNNSFLRFVPSRSRRNWYLKVAVAVFAISNGKPMKFAAKKKRSTRKNAPLKMRIHRSHMT